MRRRAIDDCKLERQGNGFVATYAERRGLYGPGYIRPAIRAGFREHTSFGFSCRRAEGRHPRRDVRRTPGCQHQDGQTPDVR